jgi:hypothetical protein
LLAKKYNSELVDDDDDDDDNDNDVEIVTNGDLIRLGHFTNRRTFTLTRRWHPSCCGFLPKTNRAPLQTTN